MVYFKLTTPLLDLVRASKLEGLVGCQVYCDRQYISYADLEQVLLKLRSLFKEVEALLEKRKAEKERLKDAEKRKQAEIMQYVRHSTARDPDSLEALNDKDLEAKLESLRKWEKLDIKQIAAEQELLFID